jgi:hypothetical protein
VTICTQDALAAGEPLAGTAPAASAWIVVEQPGPWGRKAVTESRLPEAVAEHLSSATGTGVTVLLARHADRPERSVGRQRHVWVARSAPGGSLLRHGVVDDLAELLSWDLAAIGAGRLPAIGSVVTKPVHFVCTNGTRDQCCARDGRALLSELLASADDFDRDRLWECSHIGGHRFAPVMLSLPSGAVHARLDVDAARRVIHLAEDGDVLVSSFRGRSGLLPAHQVAAIEVRNTFGISDIDAIDVLRRVGERAVPVTPGTNPLADADTTVAEVRHVDGRAWLAELAKVDLDRPRLESCSKEPVLGSRWTCTSLVEATPWR